MTETPEQELARLRAENASLKQEGEKSLSMKIGDKGGLSVYGLGRFPTTLYKEQWLALIDYMPKIKQFIAVNGHKLKDKS